MGKRQTRKRSSTLSQRARTRRANSRSSSPRDAYLNTVRYAPEMEVEENATWSDVWDSDFDPDVNRLPGPKGTTAVLRRAFCSEYDEATFPESWPAGLLQIEHDTIPDDAFLKKALKTRRLSLSPRTRAYVYAGTFVRRAIDILSHSYWHLQLRSNAPFAYTGPASQTRYVAWLDRYPNPNGVLPRYLGPLTRALLPPAITPAWYFRTIDQIQRSRFDTPHLSVHSSSGPFSVHSPLDSGWEILENWVLDLYLRGGSGRQRRSSRLEQLVKHAIDKTQGLVRGTSDVRPLATHFQDLCVGLRRALFAYATDPGSSGDDRRLGQRLLKELGDSLVPSLPPRSRERLDDEHLDRYREVLEEVRAVWSETRQRLARGLKRKKMLRNQIPPLASLHAWKQSEDDKNTRHVHLTHLLARERKMWRECGDLTDARPAHVARCIIRFAFNVDLAPDAIRKGMSRVEKDLSADSYAAKQHRTPWPEFHLSPWMRELL